MALMFGAVSAGSIGFKSVTLSVSSGTGSAGAVALSYNAGSTRTDATLASAAAVSTTYDNLVSQGYLTGLGSVTVYTFLSATGNPIYLCQSPGGGTQPPGHNPPSLGSNSGADAVAGNTSKNGKSPFGNTAPASAPLNGLTTNYTPSQLGCPNDNWTIIPLYMNWTNATITVTSDAAGLNVVAQQNYLCTMANPTTISCTLQ
jgi:hypothetical protein